MKHVVVYRNPDFYITFPSVVALSGNKIMIAFREAGSFSVRASKAGSPTHHDSDSRCCVITSNDGGESFAPESKTVVTTIEYGVNDPALTVLNNGKLVLRTSVIEVRPSSERSALKHQFLAHRPELKTISAVVGLTFQSSDNEGKTWSPVQMIEVEGTNDRFVSREPIIELEDGTLLLSVYRSVPTQVEKAYLIRSWDGGKTWKDVSLIAEDKRGDVSMFQGTNFNETAILNLGNGKLLSMIRGDSSYYTDGAYMPIGGIGELSYAFSDNAGFSWSHPKPSGIWGQPGHLLKLNNGVILCTYGYRKTPYAVKACFSYDNGKTWDLDNIITIKENCPIWDMGYPMSCQREDGKIVTVYYWVDEQNNRYIEAAIWEGGKK